MQGRPPRAGLFCLLFVDDARAVARTAQRKPDIMTQSTLRADCARCAALCCVALAFDRSELFAIDKPAGACCPHLGHAGQCSIHAQRLQRGFGGCVGYDCLGAGQRVVQDLFGAASWQDDPTLLQPMLRAFWVVGRAHELMSLLEEASKLSLSRGERRRLTRLKARLEASAEAARTTVWDDNLGREVATFLRSLKHRVQRPARPPCRRS